ncbi:MAG: PAS domain S-box protein [Caldilineaceae bacterium]
MAQRPYRPTIALVLAVLASLLMFALDPKVTGAHVWAYYLLPFAVVALWGRQREIYAISALLNLLIIGTLWFEPAPPPAHIVNFHLLPLAVLWVLAWLAEQHLQTQAQLEQQVQTRTAELQASEERYRLLSENAIDVVWAVDLQGNPTYFSPSVAQLRGYSAEEEFAMPWDERVATGFNPEGGAHMQAALAALLAGTPLDTGPVILEHRHRNGSPVWVENSVGPLYDAMGRLIGLRGTSRNITRRHLAEEALQRSEDRLAKIFRSSPGAIAITRIADGIFVDVNEAYEAMIGYSREQLLGRTAAELGILPANTRAMLAAAAQAQTYVRGAETQCVTAGGQTLDVLLGLEQIEFDGQACFLLLIFDITARKRYEQMLEDTNAVLEVRVAERTADLQAALTELQRANQLKDEFMAMISHELRTPLAGVLSMVELLEDRLAGPLSPRQAVYVQSIRESGDRLLEVINSILSYTHLLAGRMQLRSVSCDLYHLLAAATTAQLSKTAIRQQIVKVEVVPPGLTIESDPVAIAEVIKRLLDNASKFTPDGGQICLQAHAGPAQNTGQKTVAISVEDTGIGIAPDQLTRIRRPFTQLDAGLARRHEGIGLGLAYVDEMVRLLGGSLDIESSVGHGSCFTMILPA